MLDYAVELAKDTNKQILILNVINQRELFAIEKPFSLFPAHISVGISAKDIISKLKIDRSLKLNQFVEENFSEKKTLMKLKIKTGVPFECILETIDTDDIDLVIMANKGRSNISKVLFGSAAEKVFRHSPVPVLSIRGKKEFKRTD